MNLPKQYPNDTQAAKGLSQLKNAPTRPKNHNGEWTRETSKPRNEDRPLPNPQWQSRQPHTVEVPTAWLERLIEIGKKAEVKHFKTLSQCSTDPSELNYLKGYIESGEGFLYK